MVLGVSSHEILLTNEGGTQDGGCAESMTDEEWLGEKKKNKKLEMFRLEERWS